MLPKKQQITKINVKSHKRSEVKECEVQPGLARKSVTTRKDCEAKEKAKRTRLTKRRGEVVMLVLMLPVLALPHSRDSSEAK